MTRAVEQFMDDFIDSLAEPEIVVDITAPKSKEDQRRIRAKRKRVESSGTYRGTGLKKHKQPKYRRSLETLTDIDKSVIAFLGVCRYASSEHMGQFLNVKNPRQRLYGLAELGVIESVTFWKGFPVMWRLTRKGLRYGRREGILRQTCGKADDSIPELSQIEHHLSKTQAYLWILQNSVFTVAGRRFRPTLSMLRDELEIDRLVGGAFSGCNTITDRRTLMRDTFAAAAHRDRSGAKRSETVVEYPLLWHTFDPSINAERGSHRVDGVIDMEVIKDIVPIERVSVAIEVETSEKSSSDYYREILRGFMSDRCLYRHVLYFYRNRHVRTRLINLAREEFGDDRLLERVTFIELPYDKDGETGVGASMRRWT